MSWIHRIFASFSVTGTGTPPDVRKAWGRSFTWTPLHPTPEQQKAIRSRWDTLADEALIRLNAVRGKRDLYTTLKEGHETDNVLTELWSEVNAIPEWVDWEQIERGQQVFYRYATAMLNGLAYQSLLGGMGANRIAEVLARTGGFSKSVARRRMYETTQHILQCTQSLGSVQPGGAGHISSVRVRLLHAAVRARILKLREAHPDYYDLETLGVPINDLDSINTILSFSASLLWMSLPRQGLFPRKQEIADYMALWRLIAHYMGCPTSVFATPELAKAHMEAFMYYEIKPSQASKVLSQNIISSLAGQPPSYPSADFLVATTRWLNGNELCDMLGLPQASLLKRALVLAQCVFCCYIGYSSRMFPALDARKIAATKKILYKAVVEAESGLGGETKFGFQFVPQLTTETEAGAVDMEKTWREMKGAAEMRSAKVLLICLVILGFVGLTGMWLFVKLLRLVGLSLPAPYQHRLRQLVYCIGIQI